MTIVVTANCAVYPRPWMDWYFSHFLTAGLLKLLSGKPIALPRDVYAALTADPAKQDTYFPCRFEPLPPKDVGALVWSPYADLVLPESSLVDEDGDEFAHQAKQTWGSAFIDRERDVETVLTPLWERLGAATKDIPAKIIIIYPTHLMWETSPEYVRRKRRIADGMERARQVLEDRGWTSMALSENIPSKPGSNWWAHFLPSEVQSFTDSVGERLKRSGVEHPLLK